MAASYRSGVLLCIGTLVTAIIGCQPATVETPRDGGGNAPLAGTTPDAPRDQPQVVQPGIVSDAPPRTPLESEQPDLLGVGDPAPPLSIQTWFIADPIEGFAEDKIHVVEFWATWCGPCRTSMPHLSQLQQEYADAIQIIGVTREAEGVVQKFLGQEQSPGKKWAEVITYRLASDKQGATTDAYMVAAGQTGIPTAFIVGRDGILEWIGHPMSIDEPLRKIVDGQWDRATAQAELRRLELLKQRLAALNGLIRSGEWDQALALLDQLAEDLGSSLDISRMKLSVLRRAGRAEAASQLEAEIVDQAWNDAGTLNEIAWGIATGGRQGDLDLALKAAERASELRDHEDAAILDTLARVYYEQGELDQAIDWQRKAVERNSGHPAIDAALKQYETEKSSPAPAP